MFRVTAGPRLAVPANRQLTARRVLPFALNRAAAALAKVAMLLNSAVTPIYFGYLYNNMASTALLTILYVG